MNRLTCLLAIFHVVALSPVSAATADLNKIRLKTQVWEPYHSVGKEGKPDGIAVKVVSCILQQMKRPHEMIVLPWVRARRDVEMDQADGFFAASLNSARDAYAIASQPIAECRSKSL